MISFSFRVLHEEEKKKLFQNIWIALCVWLWVCVSVCVCVYERRSTRALTHASHTHNAHSWNRKVFFAKEGICVRLQPKSFSSHCGKQIKKMFYIANTFSLQKSTLSDIFESWPILPWLSDVDFILFVQLYGRLVNTLNWMVDFQNTILLF